VEEAYLSGYSLGVLRWKKPCGAGPMAGECNKAPPRTQLERQTAENKRRRMGGEWMFENKQVVVLGERDGVSGGAIQACVEAVGTAKVAFAATECFV